VFKFAGPNDDTGRRFEWVGVASGGTGIKRSEELFLTADNTSLTIGAEAIVVRDELVEGMTRASATFGNREPLAAVADDGFFTIDALEVFAFAEDER